MKEQEQKIMRTSFLDESLEITDDVYAVSYVKKSYDSANTDAERAGREHAFVIIQKPGIIYRADVKQRQNDTDFIVVKGQVEFVTMAGFKKAQHEIIWGSNDKTIHPKEHLCQWTWLVSREKAEELEVSIDLEAGSDEEAYKTAIPYFVLGEHSLATLSNTLDLIKMIVQTSVVAKAFTSAGTVAYQEINTDPSFRLEKTGCFLFKQFLSLYSGFHIGVLGGMVGGFGTHLVSNALFPTDHLPRYHNCSTWALEKLRNMGIEEINETITPTLLVSLADKAVHMASLHVGNKEESKKALEFYHRVGIRSVPFIANLEDCAQDIMHNQERAAIREVLVCAAQYGGPPLIAETGKTATNYFSL